MRVAACAAVCGLAACGRFGFGGSEPDARSDAAADAVPVLPGLIARYTLDDDPADGTADDMLGARHARCVVGVTCPSQVDGQLGKAAQFDGSAHVLRIAHDAALAPAAMTIVAWLYIDDPSFDQVAVGKPVGAASKDSWALVAWTGGPTCFETTLGGDVGEDVCNAAAMPAGRWVHVVGTWEGATKALYLDGLRVAQQTAASPIAFDDHDILIGSDENGGNPAYQWHGRVDDVHIYQRALGESEIMMLATE